MGQKKTSQNKSGKYRAVPKGNGKGKSTAANKRDSGKSDASLSLFIMPVVLVILAIVVAISLISGENSGVVGRAAARVLFGLFARCAYLIPVYLFMFGVFYRRLVEKRVLGKRAVICTAVHVLTSMLCHVAFGGAHTLSVKEHYEGGIAHVGGGVVGSLPGELLWRGLNICMVIILVGALLILIPLLFGITPKALYEKIAYRVRLARLKQLDMREERARQAEELRRAERAAGVVGYGKYKPEQLLIQTESTANDEKKKRRPMDTELDPEDELGAKPFVDPAAYEAAEKEKLFEGSRVEMTDVGDEGAPSAGDEHVGEASDAADKTSRADENKENEEGGGALTESIGASAQENGGEIDLSEVFSESSDEELVRRLNSMYGPSDAQSAPSAQVELEVERRHITEIPIDNETVPPDGGEDAGEGVTTDLYPGDALYKFPPIEMLAEDPGKRDPNIKREMEENARRLTEALASFNVKATIQDSSHGPTVTRYELSPESGTRVRTIANLVDDISLSLAAPGSVRIEAPIPGKSAVGIEVPNKTRSTVYLRSLIDSAEFANNKSKINVALGEDVAGHGVFFDIAKMPHLLIAGATGMGKSVCINCVIVSLLYKATPDEVKLILIDPKKVEFSMYNALPHLLVPVVSDPKKAAGSLSWAVNEMERRFSLIEEVGMRDIAGYNRVAENDGTREKMPQIVIIIDELADLMMTAKDAVESSICRLAQKARAAGMHLIIGTQRPSVDVITGLIKANIPSRIACTVASQTDSRTIIDRGGAEKLLGRGDMLFNPVGAQKPTRVQGAFVSEQEVEKIVDFIKGETDGEVSYSDEISAEIEREAQKCASDKKGLAAQALPGEGGEDEDPMLRAALELAVESQKISTSLIQRRLSLGYGRAAKLIDRMEQLGYVSAPDGQKPREVLISKEQFMEMVMRDDEMR